MGFVVDASVTMAWCFEDEASAATDAILDRFTTDDAHVPAVWTFEVANVLVVAQRRGRLTSAQRTRFVELLGQLPIIVETGPPRLGDLVHVAESSGLTAYDAAYLQLGAQLDLPLATLDRRLIEAARAAGISTI